ncbi:structural protein [Cellulophaga phage phi19:3]|uniref:Structural protein n=1 Tax=Cellulophaga phage phi19:3 TaxID=1327971 RepID=R9ZZ64_9CAUD|nr:structural protein [Cellulophaga phage phi19:3]AGO47532.1 structural protein [Cellulophaga phage phi19:3]
MQPTPPNKSKVLYDAVSKDYDLGTYEEFETKLQDPSKRKAFYEGVGSEYSLGSYDDFETKITSSLKKKTFQNLLLKISNRFRGQFQKLVLRMVHKVMIHLSY